MTTITSVFMPTLASSTLRARIAKVVTEHRYPRPRTPFWNLRVHRIPTLWSLYRGLLRNSPTSDIKWRIRRVFEKYRHLTGPRDVRKQLLKYHRWADIFAKAKGGDEHLQAVLLRYSRLIAVKKEKEELKEMLVEAFDWQRKLRHRSILTGGYLRPTYSNPPLPRLKPQPEHISGMIHKRRKAHTKRRELQDDIAEWLDLVKFEKVFEDELASHVKRDGARFETFFSRNLTDWTQILNEMKVPIYEQLEAGTKRKNTPYPPELLAAIKDARREKIANKTRERQRETRGETLRRTIIRSRTGPPAHVLVKMTPLEKHYDKVSRSSVSEVGYVGMVKRKLGWKIQNPEAWKIENGKPENQAWLKVKEKEIRRENLRKLKEILEPNFIDKTT